MTPEQLGQLSNYCVGSATVVLALAFLAYAAQWGLARSVPVTALREPVAAGADRGADRGADWGAQPLPDAAEEFDERATGSRMASSIAFSLTVLATMILIVGVVTRGLAAQRVPWGNMYEFGSIGTAVLLVGYIGLVKAWKIDWAGLLVTLFSVVVLGSSMLFVYVPPAPLVPSLDSIWLIIHVAGAIISGAAFAVGAVTSVLFLIKDRAERKIGDGPRKGLIWRMPSSAVIDQVAYRVHAFAFPIWTFAALIAGPIWAQAAWGRFWGWDAKEVWAFITWVIYAAYLHARVTRGTHGRTAAILALLGFAAFLFNYIGVNLFLGGLHSYAK